MDSVAQSLSSFKLNNANISKQMRNATELAVAKKEDDAYTTDSIMQYWSNHV